MAFWDIGREWDPMTGAPRRIPIAEMRGWLDELGVQGQRRRDWLRFWSAMDRMFIQVTSEEKGSGAQKA